MIKNIVVIGSGMMGSAIAAIAASAKINVLLLDQKGNSGNEITEKALKIISDPKNRLISHHDNIKFIKIGNIEDDLSKVTDYDLIIEVIIENLEIKRQLYQSLIPFLKDKTIIASNTSTFQLKELKKELPEKIQKNFLITHFFNPARYMELLELVYDEQTDKDILKEIKYFLEHNLGKTIIECADTPGFIANRVGCFFLENNVRKAIDFNICPVIVDNLLHKIFFLPSTGAFGLYDLIGHDVMRLISKSLIDKLQENDLYRYILKESTVLEEMYNQKLLGKKTNAGFYRINRDSEFLEKEVFNFVSLNYEPLNIAINNHNQRHNNIAADNITNLLSQENNISKYFYEILDDFYEYLEFMTSDLYLHLPSNSDKFSIRSKIDLVMQLGYNWKFGPYRILKEIIEPAEISLSPKLQKIISEVNKENKQQETNKNINITVLENDEASAHLENNILVFNMKTKMNCLTSNIFSLLLKTIDYANKNSKILVINSSLGKFSAGADLKFIKETIENKKFRALRNFLTLGQEAMIGLKRATNPVISCPISIALGGGCEILLHSSHIIAETNLSAGLVETKLGLLPAFGGTKEMFFRSKGEKNKLAKLINNIIKANRTSSAEYFAQDYAIENIEILMNKHHLLLHAAENKKDNLSKVQKPETEIYIPKFSLQDHLDIDENNETEKILITLFQGLIDYQNLTEEKLLNFEVETFLTLAENTNCLAKFSK